MKGFLSKWKGVFFGVSAGLRFVCAGTYLGWVGLCQGVSGLQVRRVELYIGGLGLCHAYDGIAGWGIRIVSPGSRTLSRETGIVSGGEGIKYQIARIR